MGCKTAKGLLLILLVLTLLMITVGTVCAAKIVPSPEGQATASYKPGNPSFLDFSLTWEGTTANGVSVVFIKLDGTVGEKRYANWFFKRTSAGTCSGGIAVSFLFGTGYYYAECTPALMNSRGIRVAGPTYTSNTVYIP